MQITYKDRRIEKVCTNATISERTYGTQMAERIKTRIRQINAARTVEELIENHIGRCHPLTGNRKGQYAMDLVHPYRLIFERRGNRIQIAHVTEIVDYH